LAARQATQEALGQSVITNVANLVVQAALQVIALTPSNLLASDGRQLSNLVAQLSRIAGNGDGGALIVVRINGSLAHGVAASQHGNSHDAGQQQGSNLLE